MFGLMSLLAQAAEAVSGASSIPSGVVAGIVGALTSGGVVAAAFRWLAHRDDNREAGRDTERREFLGALKAQQESCREELHAIIEADKYERGKDRDFQHESVKATTAALAVVQHSLIRIETRLATESSGRHDAAPPGVPA